MHEFRSSWNINAIPESELKARLKKVENFLNEKEFSAMVFFSAKSILYLTGAFFIPTERPFALLVSAKGRTCLLVPQLELENALRSADYVDDVTAYPEYPGEVHPMEYLLQLIKKEGLDQTRIASDYPGAPEVMGYRGKKLADLLGVKVETFPHLIEEFMLIKSEFDIAVIKESVRWANLAHELLQERTKAGLKEYQFVPGVASDATEIMLKTLGPDFRQVGRTGAFASYRGQIGPNSYYPHAMQSGVSFKQGDTLVTGAAALLLGCNSELERVLFMGEPSKEQAIFYQHALNIQSLAFAEIRAGALCSTVDKAVLAYMEEENLMPYWRHHTGHGVGFDVHEYPYFDAWMDVPLEAGMVMTVEPGLYVKGLGGFRLSDTVLVTQDGMEKLTYYPTALEEVVIS